MSSWSPTFWIGSESTQANLSGRNSSDGIDNDCHKWLLVILIQHLSWHIDSRQPATVSWMTVVPAYSIFQATHFLGRFDVSGHEFVGWKSRLNNYMRNMGIVKNQYLVPEHSHESPFPQRAKQNNPSQSLYFHPLFLGAIPWLPKRLQNGRASPFSTEPRPRSWYLWRNVDPCPMDELIRFAFALQHHICKYRPMLEVFRCYSPIPTFSWPFLHPFWLSVILSIVLTGILQWFWFIFTWKLDFCEITRAMFITKVHWNKWMDVTAVKKLPKEDI